MYAGDPENQWEWHESFRDMSKNQYRTSYTDMSHGREVSVKSDYPSGYGGHIPNIRHDVLHRNTAVDREICLRKNDPSRDAHPSFADVKDGLPWFTAFPRGSSKALNPSKGVFNNATTTHLKHPFGTTPLRRHPLNYRTPPPTMTRSASSPALQSAGNSMMGAGSSPVARTVSQANLDADSAPMPTESEILMGAQGAASRDLPNFGPMAMAM